METSDTVKLIRSLMRKVDALHRDLVSVKEIINADCRTADRLISVSEACGMLGLKKSAVYQMIQSGELPAVKEHGKRYRLSFNQVQNFISH